MDRWIDGSMDRWIDRQRDRQEIDSYVKLDTACTDRYGGRAVKDK